MLFIDPKLGPDTVLSRLDPNLPDVYGDICPMHAKKYELNRLVYIGSTVLNLADRAQTNLYHSGQKNTPYLRYVRKLLEHKMTLGKRYLPFPQEQNGLDYVTLENLLNAQRSGGGRRPEVDWSPNHIDAALSCRPIFDLVAEYGIMGHHWTRLRHRLADLQDPAFWLSADDLRFWSISDVYNVFKP